jgi:hypothetical protein
MTPHISLKAGAPWAAGTLLLLVLVGWLLFHQANLPQSLWAFPNDDAWIHMTFGRNLSSGNGFGLNPDEPSAGSTSVLWSLWLAFLHKIASSFGLKTILALVKLSGIALGIGAIAGIACLFSHVGLSRTENLIGIVFLLLIYPLNWAVLSGMEVPLGVFLCVWGLYFQIRGSSRSSFGAGLSEASNGPESCCCTKQSGIPEPGLAKTSGAPGQGPAAASGGPEPTGSTGNPGGDNHATTPEKSCCADFHRNSCNPGFFSLAATVCWALAACARPENAIFVLVMPLVAIAHTESSRGKGRALLAHGIAAALVLVPFGLIQLALTGSIIPNTLAAKMTENALPLLWQNGTWGSFFSGFFTSPFSYLHELFLFLLFENMPATAVLIAFPWAYRQRNRAIVSPASRRAFLAAWASLPGFAVLVGWVAGPEHYTLAHGRYLAQTVYMAGIPAVLFGLRLLETSSKQPLLLGLFTLLLLGFGLERQFELGPRAALENKNIADLQVRIARWFGAGFPPGKTVGVNDIGAMGYFSRQRVIDLEGLCNPSVIPFRRRGDLLGYLEQARPNALLIFPYWYPDIVKAPHRYRPLRQMTIEKNVTGGGEAMVLFSTPWADLPQPLPPFPEPGLPEAVPVSFKNPAPVSVSTPGNIPHPHPNSTLRNSSSPSSNPISTPTEVPLPIPANASPAGHAVSGFATPTAPAVRGLSTP